MRARNLTYHGNKEYLDELQDQYSLMGYRHHPGMDPLPEKAWDSFHSNPHFARGDGTLIIMALSPKPPKRKDEKNDKQKRSV